MVAGDWLELATLQLLSKHTTSILAAGVSFFVITLALKWLVGPGWLHNVLEYMDEAVLFILFLWFT